MTTFAVTSVSSNLCHASTCLRIGSKFLCMRSTPTEMQSIKENDFECLASTGVKSRKRHVRADKHAITAGHRETHALVVRVAQADGKATTLHFGCEVNDSE